MAEYENVIYERNQRTAIVTLNRPEKLNSLSREMQAEVRHAFLKAEHDPDVRVIVLTGEGRGFCTGADVRDLDVGARRMAEKNGAAPNPAAGNPVPRFFHDEVKKPIVAAINGVVAGMGYSMAVGAEIKIASEQARFAHIYLRRALVTSGEVWFLPRLIGLTDAFWHILLSEDITAEQALQYRLVNKVVPHDKLMDETLAVCRILEEKPPLALQYTKQAIWRGLDLSYNDTMEYIGYARAIVGQAGEFAEGTRAFLEKRQPVF
ncbi:MAG: enoyl-CoA hydratase/isomerase family protein [Dehalococcoidia bacterium]